MGYFIIAKLDDIYKFKFFDRNVECCQSDLLQQKELNFSLVPVRALRNTEIH